MFLILHVSTILKFFPNFRIKIEDKIAYSLKRRQKNHSVHVIISLMRRKLFLIFISYSHYLLDIRYSAQRAFVFLYFGIAYSSNKKIITFHRIISSKSQQCSGSVGPQRRTAFPMFVHQFIYSFTYQTYQQRTKCIN